MNYQTKKDLEKELNEYLDACYECSAYSNDYYLNDAGEMVSNCTTCYIHRHLEDINRRLAEMEE